MKIQSNFLGSAMILSVKYKYKIFHSQGFTIVLNMAAVLWSIKTLSEIVKRNLIVSKCIINFWSKYLIGCADLVCRHYVQRNRYFILLYHDQHYDVRIQAVALRIIAIADIGNNPSNFVQNSLSYCISTRMFHLVFLYHDSSSLWAISDFFKWLRCDKISW